MTDDTARRERAETDELAWVRRNCTVEEIRVQEAGLVRGYLAGAREEAARAATKLRAAAAETRTPFGEQLLRLAAEIEEGA